MSVNRFLFLSSADSIASLPQIGSLKGEHGKIAAVLETAGKRLSSHW